MGKEKEKETEKIETKGTFVSRKVHRETRAEKESTKALRMFMIREYTREMKGERG